MTSAKTPRIRVAALIVDADKVLLVEHEKAGRRYWLLPGGGVEYGEGLAVALAREVLEETGLTVEVGELALALDSIEPEGERHIVNLVFTATMKAGTLTPETGGRVVNARFVPLDSLKTMEVRPDLRVEVAEFLTGNGRGARYLGVRWRLE